MASELSSKPLSNGMLAGQTGNQWDPFGNGNHGEGTSRNSRDSGKESAGPDSKTPYFSSTAPSLKAPTGGGALKAIDEKFEVTAATGSCSLSIPFTITPGRNELTPEVSLSYDSSGGNGPFGLGWTLSLPSITRKTSKGIPQYLDHEESDVFILAGLEDLVPNMTKKVTVTSDGYAVRQYKPRTEGSFHRIERWSKGNDSHWRVITATNVTSVYGQTSNSKIMNSADGRVAVWHLCYTYDTKGNAIQYTYKEEDSVGIDTQQANELHRTSISRSCKRYIKAIKYGNAQPNRDSGWMLAEVPADQWLFEVVFDYGDHVAVSPTATPDRSWPTRKDPFSTYNWGFEVRTYRLCRRILLFHHFPDELGVKDYLVRSMELEYNESPSLSTMLSLTQKGHALDTSVVPPRPVSRSLPRLVFGYSTGDPTKGKAETVLGSSVQNLPVGLNDPYHWLDLEGVGKPGLVYCNEGAWYHMNNISTFEADYHNTKTGHGTVEFAPAEQLKHIPAALASGTGAAFIDLDGNGCLDFVKTTAVEQGFYERTVDGDWTEFRSFASWPIHAVGPNPNLRYIDLTGDGLADIVISEADNLLWYRSLGTDGYSNETRVSTGNSEDEGPRLLFQDGLEILYLADMSGDGLADIVRIRCHEVCYWPNLGYGHFGAKVSMNNAPGLFNSWDKMTSKRIRLADLDGSGTLDILYFPPEGGLQMFLNHCGNTWSDALNVDFPQIDTFTSLDVVDLFGIGISSLVWSSRSPNGSPTIHYFDFARGIKPHLLTSYKNGPVETRLEYKPSTSFWQLDHQENRKWPTRLPFPVHCLSKVVSYDHLNKSFHQRAFNYHDGFYDGIEREFRGFGKVEKVFSERFLIGRSATTFPTPDEAQKALVSSPPGCEVTWFHTGCYEMVRQMDEIRSQEYYSSPALQNSNVSLRNEPHSPSDLSANEMRQACRSMKGLLLRKEVYLLDGSAKEPVPFSIVDNSYITIRQQSDTGVRPAVFLTALRECLTIHLDREPKDPKVEHVLNMEIDDWGHVRKSAFVHYGRLATSRANEQTAEDWLEQGFNKITYIENDFTNAVETSDGLNYHKPLPAGSREYEVSSIQGGQVEQQLQPYLLEDLLHKIQEALLAPRLFSDLSSGFGARPISRKIIKYRSDDLLKLLEKGNLEPLALPGTTYTLALSSDILENAGIPSSWTEDSKPLTTMGYVHADPTDTRSLWISSGETLYSDSSPALQKARDSFFQPTVFVDPFASRSKIVFDKWQLHPVEATDALGNKQSTLFDYRTMQSTLFTDENGNMTATNFDELGNPMGQAVMGKKSTPLGNSLDLQQPFSNPDSIKQLRTNMAQAAPLLLRNASSISLSAFPSFEDATGWSPGFNISISRLAHVNEVPRGGRTQVHIVVEYFDTRGQEMQRRTATSLSAGRQEWVVTDCKLSNRKSVVVRQYDSFFQDSHRYSPPNESDVVFSTSFYDPVGRKVAILMPNATWTKTIYAAWSEASYDPGDLVLVDDPFSDPDVGCYLSGIPEEQRPKKTWYSDLIDSNHGAKKQTAESSKVYAGTSTVIWRSVLGKDYAIVSDNGVDGKYIVRTFRDIQDRVYKVKDSLGRLVTLNNYDMAGGKIHAKSMDTGERWLLNDVMGNAVFSLDSRGFEQATTYDLLRRPTEIRLKAANDSKDWVVQKTIYGEGLSDAQTRNVRGKVYQSYDQAQISTIEAYDHSGNATRGFQQLVKEYQDIVDWRLQVPMEDDLFRWSAKFDALSKILSKTRTDGSVTVNSWDQRGLLDSVSSMGTAAGDLQVIKAIQYNARGQRTIVDYGNGARTEYSYDPLTFNLARKKTVGNKKEIVQDYQFFIDCTGRRTRIDDAAQQTIFFRGSVVAPSNTYTYDAVGRLVKATGREHLGQVGNNWISVPHSSTSSVSKTASPSDGRAMAGYTEEYRYDSEGNFLSMKHDLTDSTVTGWTRTYEYNEPSLLESGKYNNRLSVTKVGDSTTEFRYDGPDGKAGLVTGMSGFSVLKWDFASRMKATATQNTSEGTPETTWYRYDSTNRRVRKVTEAYAAAGEVPAKIKDHSYIHHAEVEVFRQYGASSHSITSEQWSWHVKAADSNDRIALVEGTKKLGNDSPPTWDNMTVRFMLSDQAASVGIELDTRGTVVSYEEYSPYGSTTYNAAKNLKFNKRYRFAAKERDKESSFSYFENRYLMPWLGRWLSPDPIGTQDGLNGKTPIRGLPRDIYRLIVGFLGMFAAARLMQVSTFDRDETRAAVITLAESHQGQIEAPWASAWEMSKEDFAKFGQVPDANAPSLLRQPNGNDWMHAFHIYEHFLVGNTAMGERLIGVLERMGRTLGDVRSLHSLFGRLHGQFGSIKGTPQRILNLLKKATDRAASRRFQLSQLQKACNNKKDDGNMNHKRDPDDPGHGGGGRRGGMASMASSGKLLRIS
ncbi:SpvB-domain-containing protein [Paramyrothecium foliicola]|nr:SpvB-domain-containing protein [Paramyrothecium foliicola]